MPTTAEILAAAAAQLAAAGVAAARRDAEVLWLAVTGEARAALYAHPEAEAPAAALARFHPLVAARARREPLQYLTREREFYGRRFAVTPAVLIPRPETELVAAAALDKAAELEAGGAGGRRLAVLDAGAGAGVLAVTLALELGHRAQVTGCDRSAAALAVAQANARRLLAAVQWFQADWLTALAAEPRFDLIVSNPPYVSAAEWEQLAPEVRDYEPRAALVPGPSGLEAYAALLPQAHARLRPGGWLILETGYRSAAALGPLLAGWSRTETRRDYQGWERVVRARR